MIIGGIIMMNFFRKQPELPRNPEKGYPAAGGDESEMLSAR